MLVHVFLPTEMVTLRMHTRRSVVPIVMSQMQAVHQIQQQTPTSVQTLTYLSAREQTKSLHIPTSTLVDSKHLGWYLGLHLEESGASNHHGVASHHQGSSCMGYTSCHHIIAHHIRVESSDHPVISHLNQDVLVM